MDAKTYINETKALWQEKYQNEPEFMQTLDEFVDSIEPVLEEHPEYIQHNILQLLAIPERIITFRIPWTGDDGQVHVNTGYRVQFNSALGPYKGGLRFHPSVNQSILKFLGFEQIFKNALTQLPIGGGKGGSDFDPKGKSDQEIMRFCQSLMTELQKYIGPDLDVPAGDIGVGAREIGYLFGQYKKIQGFKNGVITGKPLDFGGSLARKQATGYGTVYFVERMLQEKGESIEGKRALVSGAGNVAIYAIEKLQELGGIAISTSDSNGYIIDESGIDVDLLKEVKEVKRERLSAYAELKESATYYEGSVWSHKIEADIALPCATQNEIDESHAKQLIENGVTAISEGANMPLTAEATIELLNHNVFIGPAKAANAGGVAVSALEMSQNSQRLHWSFDEVDNQLHKIMDTIYDNATQAAKKYGYEGNLIKGANMAAFIQIADAMIMQGIV